MTEYAQHPWFEERRLVVAGYAPTLSNSEKNPAAGESDQLTSAVNTIASRDIYVVVGDFNAKTGSGWKYFPENVGDMVKATQTKTAWHY